ncbi:MAG: hypothetical protein V4581_18165 [Bacteroidota bacterium]
MKISTILLLVSLGAFIFSRIAKAKAKGVLVTADLTIDEERIKALRLFKGQEVALTQDDESGMINVYTKENGVPTDYLGNYKDSVTYDQLGRKPVNAYIFGIYGNLVTVEVLLNDSL